MKLEDEVRRVAEEEASILEQAAVYMALRARSPAMVMTH